MRQKELKREWYLIDASNATVGRLATRVATVLMGKHKPTYVTYLDCGDNVIIVNCSKVRLTGDKAQTRVYKRYSGYMSGEKELPYARAFERDPTFVVRESVRRMLPKTNLGRLAIRKLKLYEGAEHPHKIQSPKVMKLTDIRKGRV
ncbi:MAG: 50S ribosomal protein L13 [Planctomycetes bacterium]|nr:50S ribosomal protein L13 [Planctomycetota bacterium]